MQTTHDPKIIRLKVCGWQRVIRLKTAEQTVVHLIVVGDKTETLVATIRPADEPSMWEMKTLQGIRWDCYITAACRATKTTIAEMQRGDIPVLVANASQLNQPLEVSTEHHRLFLYPGEAVVENGSIVNLKFRIRADY